MKQIQPMSSESEAGHAEDLEGMPESEHEMLEAGQAKKRTKLKSKVKAEARKLEAPLKFEIVADYVGVSDPKSW